MFQTIVAFGSCKAVSIVIKKGIGLVHLPTYDRQTLNLDDKTRYHTFMISSIMLCEKVIILFIPAKL